MARVAQPAPDGHSRRLPTIANRDFVFVPMTQQRRVTPRHAQFLRHGGDGEQRRQAFKPRLPMEMSRGGKAEELITRLLPVFFRPFHRKPQLQGCGFGRKSRFQPPDLFGPALLALERGVNLGDFIPLPLKMHRRAADSQHPPDFGVGFVQVLADDFEPLPGQGTLPLGFRFGVHKVTVINRNFCREFKHNFIARCAVSVAMVESGMWKWFVARPHPGLLPEEKEKRPPRFWNVMRRDWPDHHPQNEKRECVKSSPGGEDLGEGGRKQIIFARGVKGKRCGCRAAETDSATNKWDRNDFARPPREPFSECGCVEDQPQRLGTWIMLRLVPRHPAHSRAPVRGSELLCKPKAGWTEDDVQNTVLAMNQTGHKPIWPRRRI